MYLVEGICFLYKMVSIIFLFSIPRYVKGKKWNILLGQIQIKYVVWILYVSKTSILLTVMYKIPHKKYLEYKLQDTWPKYEKILYVYGFNWDLSKTSSSNILSHIFLRWGLIIIPPKEKRRSTGSELGKQVVYYILKIFFLL